MLLAIVIAAFPKPPAPALAALAAPFVWLYACPELFDSYSVGILLLQLAVPQLRSATQLRTFNNELRQVDYDLEKWRGVRGSR